VTSHYESRDTDRPLTSVRPTGSERSQRERLGGGISRKQSATRPDQQTAPVGSRRTDPSDPQPEYHQPVKAAVTELRENINDVVGIILYGSVARGEADRRSDIDLWVLTRSGRAESQREANAIARDLEDTEFDGDRYAYDIDVEAVQAIPAYTEDIREIVVSGIPVYKTNDFETVENLLLEEGATDE